jgi:hypothetical protein
MARTRVSLTASKRQKSNPWKKNQNRTRVFSSLLLGMFHEHSGTLGKKVISNAVSP